ncbi:MAG: type II toxin-antitoxin system VapC family toxin [Holophagales bacterium]|nr:type II toxin-antitoxin system VapC family toxin [Holophagales bacterium]
MRYWDASALVPLFVDEPESERVREWFAEDDGVVTWVWTRAEIVSALERRCREVTLSRPERRELFDFFHALAAGWDEVTDVLAVRSRAELLLARHSLRAADAGQLGAALLIQDQFGGALPFVCLDERLSAAAELEGLRAIP